MFPGTGVDGWVFIAAGVEGGGECVCGVTLLRSVEAVRWIEWRGEIRVEFGEVMLMRSNLENCSDMASDEMEIELSPSLSSEFELLS